MQPKPTRIRIILVVMKNRWLKVSRGLLLALLLVATSACSGPEAADAVTAAESLVDAPAAQPVAAAETNSLAAEETSDLSAFSTFLAPVTFRADTEECQLSSDPYSTCI